jgi:predicted nicotinamide N-methyase
VKQAPRPDGKKLWALEDVSVELKTGNADAELDALIARDGDERDLPYWVDLWPSAQLLAMWLVAQREHVQGKAVADLGCGLGLAAIVAAKCGATRVRGLEYIEDAVKLAQENIESNGVADVATVDEFDWRSDVIPDDTELLIASDILYDRKELPYIEDLLHHRCPTGCEVVITEPGRAVAEEFFRPVHWPGWGWQHRLEAWNEGDKSHFIHLWHGQKPEPS